VLSEEKGSPHLPT
jgi:hypothetical protein